MLLPEAGFGETPEPTVTVWMGRKSDKSQADVLWTEASLLVCKNKAHVLQGGSLFRIRQRPYCFVANDPQRTSKEVHFFAEVFDEKEVVTNGRKRIADG